MFYSFKKYLKTIDFFPIVLFCIAAVLWRTEYSRVTLYILLPSVIVYAFYKYYKKITRSSYFLIYVLLIGWMVFASNIAPNQSKSMSIMVSVAATFLVSFSMVGLSSKGNNAKWLYFGYMSLFVSIMYAVIASNGQILVDFDYANEHEREQATLMDANQYAYFSMFALMALRLYLGDKPIKSTLLRVGLYLLMAFVAFYVALITASRQVLMLQIPMICYFVYFDFIRSKRNRNNFLPVLFIVALVILLSPYALDQYYNSYLFVRSDSSVYEDTRWRLLRFGLKTGWENPIIGIGLGSKGRFTHCTYTHLFSRCGLLAMILFLVIVIKPFTEQQRRYRNTHDDFFRLYQFCILIFIVANLFYSYINQPFMMSFLFLIIGDSDKKYQNILENKQIA